MLVTNKSMVGIKNIVEVDRLKAENRLLKAQLLRKEMEDAYSKKVMEIRNREANDSSNNKLSKN